MSAIIGIMAKAPRPGRVKTRLSPPLSPAATADLARAFLVDTVERVARIGGARKALVYAPPASRPFFERIAPGFLLVPQSSGDLGRRMSAALDRLLALGVGPVVLVGSDVPSLPTRTLTAALRALEGTRTDVVLGPSEDGGYYLIGLRRPCAALFEAVAWSTATVFEETRARARARRLRVAVLAPWWDVDTPADLARLRRWLDTRPDSELPATRRALARWSVSAAPRSVRTPRRTARRIGPRSTTASP